MMLVDLRDRRGRGEGQVILPYLVVSPPINKITNKQNQIKKQTKEQIKRLSLHLGFKGEGNKNF